MSNEANFCCKFSTLVITCRMCIDKVPADSGFVNSLNFHSLDLRLQEKLAKYYFYHHIFASTGNLDA